MTYFTLALLFSAVLTVIPAVWSLRRWHAPGARPFFMLGIAAAAWTLTEAGAQLSQTASWQLWFDKVSYISAFTPLAALLLALDYRGMLGRLRPGHWAAILAIPTLTLLFALTNDYHHLIWTHYGSTRVNGIRFLHVQYGLWFWVFELYVMVSALGGTILLFQTLWTSTKLQASQSALIAAGILTSWVANTAYTFRLGPWPGLDLSPIGCSIAAVLCVLSLHRFGLFDLVPVAYDTLVQNLADGVIVVDNQQRLLFLNTSASKALRATQTRIGDVFIPPFLTAEGQPISLEPCNQVPCEIDQNGITNYFELTISPLIRTAWGVKPIERGRVILLHDITTSQVQQLALELSQDELMRINTELYAAMEEAARARAFVESILASTPNMVYIYDLATSRCTYVNEMAFATIGYTADKIMTNTRWMRAGIHRRDQAVLRDHLAQCRHLKLGDILEVEYRARHANGHWRWILSRHSAFKFDESGAVTQLLGSAADITSRRHNEAVVQEQEQRWQLALHGNSDGLWDWDIRTGTTYRSAGWWRMLGYTENDGAAGSLADWRTLAHPEDLPRVDFDVREHLSGATEQFACEYRLRTKSGDWLWVLDRGRCIRDDQGTPIRMAGSQTDITARKLIEQRLATEALIDPLTNLPNRRYLLLEFEEAFQKARKEGSQFAVAVGDIDRFKTVNDNYGHAAGDRVLAKFAELLRPCLRAGDFAGRLGGDEFCIFFPRSGAERARRALDRLRTQFSETIFTEPGRMAFSVSISFGVADLTLETDSARLLEAADRALYQAKNEGRNQTYSTSPTTLPREAIN